MVRSSVQFKAAASLVKEVSGIGAHTTLKPRRSRGRTMLLQQVPSAHAACTKTIVEFSGNSLLFAARPGTLALDRAVSCARPNSVKDPSSTRPKDAAVAASRNLRRSISSPRSNHVFRKNQQATTLLTDLSTCVPF